MRTFVIFISLICVFTDVTFAQTDSKLRIIHDVNCFEETLEPENGKMVASFFRGNNTSENSLNDVTPWLGEQVHSNGATEANKNIPASHEALKEIFYATGNPSKKGLTDLYESSFKTNVNEITKSDTQVQAHHYVFAYFKKNGKDGLHLAGSIDGLNWKAFKNDASFLAPTIGKERIMRDPCIISGLDGRFHMVWTDSWTDKGIGYASSSDLIHWSEQMFIPVMEKEDSTRNCWAPEITFDPGTKTYMIYWATTIIGKYNETLNTLEKGYNHRIYYVTTSDFKTFSDTKLLYDPGFNVIDATIVKDNKRFVMFLKDETREPVHKNLKIAFSDNLTGPYSKASIPITGNYWAEGPTSIKIDNTWIVYFDKYREHKYGAVTSTDLLNWTDISDKITVPSGLRHGSVLTVNESVFNLLQKQ